MKGMGDRKERNTDRKTQQESHKTIKRKMAPRGAKGGVEIIT